MEEMNTYTEFLFRILFSSVATLAFAASFYLWLRRSNAFAPDINPPLRLRRWAAAFLAAAGASQLYWLFIYYSPFEGDLFHRALLCLALDSVMSTPAIMCTMLVLLQDRRRPLWPVFAAMALYLVYLLLFYILDIRNMVYVVLPLLLIFTVFGIVLVHAVRQYDRWLSKNYADLEHKEVRTSIGILAAFILCAIAYSLANDYFFFEVLIELTNILLFVALLWRVETMQTLTEPAENDVDAPAG